MRQKSDHSGFTLIEVVLALLVALLGAVATAGVAALASRETAVQRQSGQVLIRVSHLADSLVSPDGGGFGQEGIEGGYLRWSVPVAGLGTIQWVGLAPVAAPSPARTLFVHPEHRWVDRGSSFLGEDVR